jgi:hypothetical protein
VTVLTLRVSEVVDPVCEHCGSRELTRLLSRFAMVRSEDARLDDLTSDSALGDVDERDPKSMARWRLWAMLLPSGKPEENSSAKKARRDLPRQLNQTTHPHLHPSPPPRKIGMHRVVIDCRN